MIQVSLNQKPKPPEHSKMKKHGASLPINVIVIVIIALLVLTLILFFYSQATGKQIFPAIVEKIKIALGLWNATAIKP